jgi:hypothetical protein
VSAKEPINMPPSDRIGATDKIGSKENMGTPTQSFQSFMDETKAGGSAKTATPSMSPFDLAHGPTTLPANPSFNTLLTQTQAVQSAFGGVQTQLSYPDLKLKQSTKYVLKNKLPEANSLLRTVNMKLGTEPPPETPTPAGMNPVMKFLNMVTDGQNQLDSAKMQLSKLRDQGGHLNPGDMLMIQVKMSQAQQLIEFSSIVLSKAVDGFKQMMQIQL